jgi:hypothetical protein
VIRDLIVQLKEILVALNTVNSNLEDPNISLKNECIQTTSITENNYNNNNEITQRSNNVSKKL